FTVFYDWINTDQIYQINLKRGRGPIFTEEQEREIINMVLANNAIRLREIKANIIGDHAIFNNVHQVSQSTLAHILKRHQVKIKQLYLYCIFRSFFRSFFYWNCNLYCIHNFTFV